MGLKWKKSAESNFFHVWVLCYINLVFWKTPSLTKCSLKVLSCVSANKSAPTLHFLFTIYEAQLSKKLWHHEINWWPTHFTNNKNKSNFFNSWSVLSFPWLELLGLVFLSAFEVATCNGIFNLKGWTCSMLSCVHVSWGVIYSSPFCPNFPFNSLIDRFYN